MNFHSDQQPRID